MAQPLCSIEHAAHSPVDWEDVVRSNLDYRRVLETTPSGQTVAMTLLGNEFIPEERHSSTTQILLVVEGIAQLTMQGVEYCIKPGRMMLIPPNHRHAVRKLHNNMPLKLLSIYTRPEHPPHHRDARQP